MTEFEKLNSIAEMTLPLAYAEALNSPDPSTQNGAVISDIYAHVYGAAHNQIIYGCDSMLHTKDKNDYMLHAERNVLRASSVGRILTAVWATCTNCAKEIVQARISTVITHYATYKATPERWSSEVHRGHSVLHTAGVQVHLYDGPINVNPIRFNGEEQDFSY